MENYTLLQKPNIMDKYTFLQKVGEGSYGCVYKAINNETHEIVAIKHLINKNIARDHENGAKEMEVVVLEALRDHPNIVQLKEVIIEHDNVYYVFEYMTENLLQSIRNKMIPPSEKEIKSWMYQILKGVAFMHSKGYLHRDLKPENILVHGGKLKIADFGLSKKICHCSENINKHVYNLMQCKNRGRGTTYVCTRWYRAPELILGSPSYSAATDMWSLGVIMAEMFRSRPIFPGANNGDQLHQISATLGPPNLYTWPEGCILASNCNFQFENVYPSVNLERLVPTASDEALNLIQSLICWNPHKRLTAIEALYHPFFKSDLISSENKLNFDLSKPHYQSIWYQNTTCAMEEKQELKTFKNHRYLSSYQQACNIIRRNSIVR